MKESKITIEAIVEETAKHFNIDKSSLTGKVRKIGREFDEVEYSYYSHVCQNVCQYIFNFSNFSEIGRELNKDRTVIFYSIHLHRDRIKINNRPGFDKFNIARSECADINAIFEALEKRFDTKIEKLKYRFINYKKPVYNICKKCGLKTLVA